MQAIIEVLSDGACPSLQELSLSGNHEDEEDEGPTDAEEVRRQRGKVRGDIHQPS